MTGDEPSEVCLFGTELLQIPKALIIQPEVFHGVLSYDTWQNELTQQDRHHLMDLLPNSGTVLSQESCLRDLFGGLNFKFGNPLTQFRTKLLEGVFEPDVSRYRILCRRAKRKQHKHRMQQYHTRLLEQLIVLQQMYLDEARKLPTKEDLLKRLHGESWQAACKQRVQPFCGSNGETLSCAVRRRQRRILQEVREETGCAGSSSDEEEDCRSSILDQHSEISEQMSAEHLMHMLRQHRKRRRCREEAPSLDTRSISSIHDVIGRVFVGRVKKTLSESSLSAAAPRHTIKGAVQSSDKMALSASPARHTARATKRMLKKRLPKPPAVDDEEHTSRQMVTAADALPGVGIMSDDWDIEGSGLNHQHAQCGATASMHHEDFFALLGQIIQSFPNSKATTQKIEERVREWQEAVVANKSSNPATVADAALSATDRWYADGQGTTNWVDLVQPALKYLAGDAAPGAPYDGTFVPLVDYKERVQQWRWLGIENMASTWRKQQQPCTKPEAADDGRDEDDMDASDDVSYRQLLWAHWLENRDSIVASAKDGGHSGRQREPTPPSRIKTTYVVKPSTDDEKASFRKQEQRRFANPRHSFTYRVNGYDAVVGPVKGVYDKSAGNASGNKAREHALLISERPGYVTILTLVRDAAARLPNGEGTRSDICELLKDSQYLADGVTESQINTVVSGALDRLHYEKDPCVKYDVIKKLWIYLHRNRSEDEFERIHEVQGAVVKAKKAQTKLKGSSAKRPRLASAVNPSTTSDVLENSCGADETGLDDLDEPPISPLGLPVDSPPVPQLPMLGSQSPARVSASVVSPSPVPHKSASVAVSQNMPNQQSLINRLAVPGTRPQILTATAVQKPTGVEPVSAPASESLAASLISAVTVPPPQQLQPRVVAPTPTAASAPAPVIITTRPAAISAAQQHYTFSLMPSTPVGGSSMVVPFPKAPAASSTSVSSIKTAAVVSATEAAASPAVHSLSSAAAPLSSVTVAQQHKRGPRHVVIRQQLSAGAVGNGTPTPPVSPPVISAPSQIRMRLEQPVSIVAPMAGRSAASVVLQPAVSGVALDRGTLVATPAPGAALAKVHNVNPATAAAAAAGTATGFAGSNQVFYQKVPVMSGATVLQKLITAVPQQTGRASLVSKSPSVVHTVATSSGTATAQAVTRIVQGSTPAANAGDGAAPSSRAGQQVISNISTLQGKTLTLPSMTVARAAGIVPVSAAPTTTFKLVASSQMAHPIGVSNAVGSVVGSTLVKHGTAAAILAGKGARPQTVPDAGQCMPSTQVVLTAPASHHMGDNKGPPRIYLSTAGKASNPASSAAAVHKGNLTVTAAPVAGATAGANTATGQLITTYYAATSGATTVSPATFILKKPFTAASVPSSSSGTMVQSNQHLAYNIGLHGAAKGKAIPVYGRLISPSAAAGGQQQTQMVITRPAGVGHPTVIVGQAPVSKNDSLIILPVKKAAAEKVVVMPDNPR